MSSLWTCQPFPLLRLDWPPSFNGDHAFFRAILAFITAMFLESFDSSFHSVGSLERYMAFPRSR